MKEKKTIENNIKITAINRKSKKNVFTEEVNKIALSANDGKRIQAIYSLETYAYWTSKNLICKNEEVKYNNIIKQ